MKPKILLWEQILIDTEDTTGIIIFWCYELLYLYRWLSGLMMVSRILCARTTKMTSRRRFFGPHPSHFTELALGLDFAVEFPFIVAFHPSTQYYGIGYGVPYPCSLDVFTHLIIFFAVEEVLKSQIHRLLPPCDGQLGRHSLNGPHSAVCGLSIDYVLPRATLWLAIPAVGRASLLCGITGRLHMVPIIIWVVLRQLWGHNSLTWHYTSASQKQEAHH